MPIRKNADGGVANFSFLKKSERGSPCRRAWLGNPHAATHSPAEHLCSGRRFFETPRRKRAQRRVDSTLHSEVTLSDLQIVIIHPSLRPDFLSYSHSLASLVCSFFVPLDGTLILTAKSRKRNCNRRCCLADDDGYSLHIFSFFCHGVLDALSCSRTSSRRRQSILLMPLEKWQGSDGRNGEKFDERAWKPLKCIETKFPLEL